MSEKRKIYRVSLEFAIYSREFLVDLVRNALNESRNLSASHVFEETLAALAAAAPARRGPSTYGKSTTRAVI